MAIVALLVPGVLLLFAAFVGRAIVAPMAVALKGRSFTWWPRIQLVDIFTLMFLLQLAGAFYAAAHDLGGASILARLALPLALGFTYGWWRGVGALAALGIRSSLRRAVFISFVLPIVLFGAILALAGFIATMFELFNTATTSSRALLVLLFPVSLLLLIAARFATEWVMAGAEQRRAPAATTASPLAETSPAAADVQA